MGMGRRKGTSATYIHTHMHTYLEPAPEALEPEGRRLKQQGARHLSQNGRGEEEDGTRRRPVG